MNRDQLHQFAAMIDRSGAIGVLRRKGRAPSAMLRLPLLDEKRAKAIQVFFSSGSIVRPAPQQRRRRQVFVWTVTARAARTVLQTVLPFLNGAKAARAHEILGLEVKPIGHKPEGWKPAERQPHWKPLRRKRIYATNAERSKAYRKRKKQRAEHQP